MQNDEQPLSLQDELKMSEDEHPETSNFRQIFDKIFTLLHSTHVVEDVT
jgi:hypothetical protein